MAIYHIAIQLLYQDHKNAVLFQCLYLPAQSLHEVSELSQLLLFHYPTELSCLQILHAVLPVLVADAPNVLY